MNLREDNTLLVSGREAKSRDPRPLLKKGRRCPRAAIRLRAGRAVIFYLFFFFLSRTFVDSPPPMAARPSSMLFACAA